MTDVTRYITTLSRILPLRHRYLLTRHNRIRLRYKIFSTAALVGLMTLSALPAKVSALTGIWSTGILEAQTRDTDNTDLTQTNALAAVETAAGRKVADAESAKEKETSKKTPAAQPKTETIKIGSGDTLGGVLNRAGLSNAEAYKIIKSIEKYYDPRQMRPGQELAVHYTPVDYNGSSYAFSGLEVDIDALKTVSLILNDEQDFNAQLIERKTVTRQYAQNAEIELSLFGSGLKAGIPAAIISEAIRIYSWDVDFQRDIRQGDKIEVLYEKIETENGTALKMGDILYARLNVNGQDIPVYRYKMDNGDIDYFTPDGRSIRKALMATPVDGARLSSGYGMRHHPVLGYAKMHKGVDFAAPRGTPIYAAGDGTIEKMQRYGSYGNYVRIRHNASLKTAYAHMQKFANGLGPGSRVKQGQTIGYIGTTGRSTGPHLHYEVLNGQNAQINPRKVDMPQGESLTGKELARFKDHIQTVNRQYVERLDAPKKGTKYAALDN